MSSHSYVAFVCLEPRHLASSTHISVTVHDGRWAACSAAVTETEHRWKAVDGMSMFEAECEMRHQRNRFANERERPQRVPVLATAARGSHGSRA